VAQFFDGSAAHVRLALAVGAIVLAIAIAALGYAR
jgi:hypothetical protein